MDWSNVLPFAVVGLLGVWFARRLAVDRAAAREGRRGSGIGQVVLLIFGGSQLPKLARNLGQAQKEFKQGLSETGEAPPDA
jgi:TatA/E family protein of Tat protein translocase